MTPEELNSRLLLLLEKQEERQSRDRGWTRFKMLMILVALSVPILVYSIAGVRLFAQTTSPHVGVVQLRGEISANSEPATQRLMRGMEGALKNPYSKGLILMVNSPGGAAGTSERIRMRLDELRKKFPDKRVIAVGEDTIASGAYLISSGAEKIVVLPMTVVGSIGVIHQSFGFGEIAKRYGVEVRTITAGKHKAMGNAFEPLRDEDRATIRSLIAQIHESFIDHVRQGRGDRLKVDDDTFSGNVWVGQSAVDRGLADEIGTLDDVRDKYFDGVEPRYYGEASLTELLSDLRMSASLLAQRLGALSAAVSAPNF